MPNQHQEAAAADKRMNMFLKRLYKEYMATEFSKGMTWLVACSAAPAAVITSHCCQGGCMAVVWMSAWLWHI
jgi:hypothetical protein